MSGMTKSGHFLPREVVVWVPPGSQLIAVMGLVEAFDAANGYRAHRGEPALYATRIVGCAGETASAAGVTLRTPVGRGDEPVHTLVVGGSLAEARAAAPLPHGGREALEALARRAERVVSVCAGTFWLGELGLLHGRRCTTHWLAVDVLAARFPTAKVETDALFTADGTLFTSAGGTAGIDLALHLIGLDGGRRLARAVARALVVFAQRPGGQSQFSVVTRTPDARSERIRRVVQAVVERPADDHVVPALARRAAMSERHFARAFRAETGATPAAFVTSVRIEAAQRLLLDGDAGLEQVAEASGFGSVESLRRAFRRVAGTSPASWRARFR